MGKHLPCTQKSGIRLPHRPPNLEGKVMTELEKYKLWDKRMAKIGPGITGIVIVGFLIVVYLILVA